MGFTEVQDATVAEQEIVHRLDDTEKQLVLLRRPLAFFLFFRTMSAVQWARNCVAAYPLFPMAW